MKEYRLTIQAAGDSNEEAIERAVRMLTMGATFDDVAGLFDVAEPSAQDRPGAQRL